MALGSTDGDTINNVLLAERVSARKGLVSVIGRISHFFLDCQNLGVVRYRNDCHITSRMTPIVVVDCLLISVPQEPGRGNYAKLPGLRAHRQWR